jgi:F-type H+-transporting ATPase subunit b
MERLITEFSFGLFFWHSLIFIGLIFLLKKFAWKPILDAVEERDSSIKKAISSAENARKEVEALKEDNSRILKEARIERDKLLKDAKKTKEDLIENAKKESKLEAQKIIDQANLSIENEKRLAIKELKNQVSLISMEIAEKVIKKELDDNNKQEEFLNKLIDETNIK